MRAARTLRLALAMLLCGTAIGISAQQAATADAGPAEQLQHAIAQQQAALNGTDTGAVLATSRHVAALALLLSGRLYRANNHNEQAALAFTRSLQVEPSSAVRAELITADLLAKQPAQEKQAEAATLADLGDTLETRLLLAEACFSADDLACTAAQLRQAIRLQPASAAAHLALGGTYWTVNEYQYNAVSLDQFTQAQKLDPAGYASNYELGALLSEYQRYTDAEPHLRAAAQADPASPDPWLQLGMNSFAQGRYAEAQPLLARAVDLTGSDLQRNGYQVRRAFAALSRIATAANQPQLASDYDAKEEAVRSAMAQAGAAPQLSQSTGLVTNSTAQGNADKPRPTADSGSTATQQQLSDIAAQSLNDAGTALARIRDYEGALPLFRLAAQVDSRLPPVLRNLGLAAFHTNHMDEAAQALKAWLQQNPGDSLAERYLQQLRSGGTPPTTQP